MNIAEQQEEIISEAWRLLHEATTTGRMTLQNGVILTPESEAWAPQLQLLRQMASLKPPKNKHQDTPDGYRPAVTYYNIKPLTESEVDASPKNP